jgi:hypothetical protein
MNKLQILIEGRVEDLALATECQKWKQLAYMEVKLALVLWSDEHTKAKETYKQWLECADLRLKEVA